LPGSHVAMDVSGLNSTDSRTSQGICQQAFARHSIVSLDRGELLKVAADFLTLFTALYRDMKKRSNLVLPFRLLLFLQRWKIEMLLPKFSSSQISRRRGPSCLGLPSWQRKWIITQVGSRSDSWHFETRTSSILWFDLSFSPDKRMVQCLFDCPCHSDNARL
jgi:hypothetical protein